MKKIIPYVLLPVLVAQAEVQFWYEPSSGINWRYEVEGDSAVLGSTAVESEGARASLTALSGRVVIPSDIKGFPVCRIGRDAFRYSSGLTEIVIPGSITNVGRMAFCGCENLTTVRMEEGVRSISSSAFSVCTKLVTVEFPSTLERIGTSAFSVANALKTVEIPEGVQVIADGAFEGCYQLVSAKIPASVTRLGDGSFLNEGVFQDCRHLKRIDVAAGNKNYQSKDGLVYDQSGRVLLACPGGLTEVCIPEGVERIETNACAYTWSRSGDAPLASVSLPSSLREIGKCAFLGCCNLKQLELPASVEVIEEQAFDSCGALEKVVFLGPPPTLDNTYEFYVVGRRVTGAYRAYAWLWEEALDEEGLWNYLAMSYDPLGVDFDEAVESPGLTWTTGGDASWVVTTDKKMVGKTSLKSGKLTSGQTWIETVLPGPCRVRFSRKCSTWSHITETTGSGDWLDVVKDGQVAIAMAGGRDWAREGVFFGEGTHTLRFAYTRYHDAGENCVWIDAVTVCGEDEREVFFDAQGGACEETSRIVAVGKSVCALPEPTRIGYSFLGWFTAREGGNRLSEDFVVGDDSVWYAQWDFTGFVPGENVNFDTGLIGYTPKNLPSGLKYDAKTGKITGAATKPTGDDGAIVTFTKKGAETETLTIVVTVLPKVTVALDGDTDGCKVTGAGSYLVGKKVSLAVTTPKGTAFTGWYLDGSPWPNETEYRKTKISYEMTRSDLALVASFEKEKMSVGCAGLERTFVSGVWDVADGIPLEIETQSGVKSVKVSNLPTGLKYDTKTGRIAGTPTKAETKKVVIEVTAVSGAVTKKEMTVTVEPPNAGVIGTFNGFVRDESFGKIDKVGSFQLVTTEAGKISAKIVLADGTYSFAGTAWDAFSWVSGGSIYSATMTTKKNEKLEIMVCGDDHSAGAWYEDQVDGRLTLASGKQLRVSAQKPVFGRPWYFKAKGSDESGWTLSNAADAKSADITITVKDGATTLAGKIGSYKVSASAFVNMSQYGVGVLKASFTPVVTVGKAKRVLVVEANLRFDRIDSDCGIAGFGR